MDRDKIIAKLNALRAKALNAGTPEEAVTFMEGFNKLMQKYKLTETDLEVKSSKVEASQHTTKKGLEEMELVATLIAELTDTRALKNGQTLFFLGLRVDVDYANWIYNLVSNSLERAYHKLPMTPEYHFALNKGVKSKEIKSNFKIGFLAMIATNLRKLIQENKVAGNALVLVKQDIIQAFIDDNGGAKEGGKANIKLYTGSEQFVLDGAVEGDKVKFRQTVENPIAGLLK